MKLSQEKIKEILDNAPAEAAYWHVNDSGAPDYDPINVYYDEHFNDCHKCGTSLREEWYAFPINLSDLRAQLEPGQEWGGEGLPPVGVECEYAVRCENSPLNPTWFDCKFIGSIDGKIYVECPHLVDDEDRWGLQKFDDNKIIFRPIETPEQKAAREREEAIKEMYAVIERSDIALSLKAEYICQGLYDAGYRKESK